jgi:Putative Actinobacterial Holin-X, holin superfamily III
VNEQAGATPASPALGRLAAQLLVQAAGLLGQEAALAKAEFRANSRQATKSGILLGGAAIAAGSAWLVFLAAVVLGIAVALPAWAAALITAAALAAAGGLLAAAARQRLARTPLGMPLTAQSLREDLQELRASALRDGSHSTVTGRGQP